MDNSVVMECFFNRSYYRGNKRILKLIGQWPFQSPVKNKCLRCVMSVIVGSIFLPKIIKLLESLDDLNLVLECIPMLTLHTGALLKYFNWAINENYMRELFLSIKRDWESLKNEQDLKLLDEYSAHGRKVDVAYASALYGFLGLYLVSPVIPPFLDLINPLNQSRPLIYLYETEYFIDQEKYYIHLLIHAYMTVPISMGSIIFFDNIFAMFISHTCGMLQILKSHLEKLDGKVTPKGVKPFEELKACAVLQTNILQFIGCLEASYTIALLLIVGMNMTVIALTGMMAIIRLDHPSEAIRFLSFNIGTTLHLFWSSWLGHVLVLQSESVFISTYHNEWYNLPPELQRMLLPLMMRSVEPCQITAGTLYVMSMESFGVVMKATMSFLTLLLSTR